ncbi:GpE family phage tail protein [Kiloniella laminariae]|uniref:GpE family phage tail protein n=1 Tax=Kiloniella laminariae TaxID=454162 RepID=A0ABT4LKQ4_9PROT|nr:GpE family phage tail protein [Kiloniella laminariae]MCZ4281693.1 GpE family phage tail protein [Kiloniella laminariae]
MVINIAFKGWPPSEMDRMPIEDLTYWYQAAVDHLDAKAKAYGKK